MTRSTSGARADAYFQLARISTGRWSGRLRLDDLVIQFDDTPTGSAFVDAWFNTRKVVDLGRRAAKPAPTPAAK